MARFRAFRFETDLNYLLDAAPPQRREGTRFVMTLPTLDRATGRWQLRPTADGAVAALGIDAGNAPVMVICREDGAAETIRLSSAGADPGSEIRTGTPPLASPAASPIGGPAAPSPADDRHPPRPTTRSRHAGRRRHE